MSDIVERLTAGQDDMDVDFLCKEAADVIKALRYDHERDAEKIAAMAASIEIKKLKIELLQGKLVKATDKIADYDGRSPELID